MSAPTVYKASTAADLVFTLTNETGIIITNYNRTVNSAVAEARDAENEVVAVAFSGKTADITVDGYLNGTLTMVVAGALTLANDTSSGGLSGGTVLVKTVATSHGQGEFQKVSVSCTQYSNSLS